jgi:hypothetical protein
MQRKPVLTAIMVMAIAMLSCGVQQGQQVSDLQTQVAALLTATAAPANPAAPPPPANVPPAAPPEASPTPCTPMVTANQNANVRNGPGTIYDPPIGNLLSGQTASLEGRNDDSSWWYIGFPSVPSGHGWISAITVTTSCVPPSLAVVLPPPTPTVFVAFVTDVSISVDPTEISVPGCMGPIMPSTITATITTNGAMKLKWHFVTQQNGNLSSHTENFNKATSKDVSDEFTPPLTPGKYWVKIVIEGQDLSGMDTQVNYKIGC